MKRTAIALSAILIWTAAKAAEPPPPDPQLNSLIKEIQAQQAALVSNQQKIESRIVAVTEAVRVARIYSSRGGR